MNWLDKEALIREALYKSRIYDIHGRDVTAERPDRVLRDGDRTFQPFMLTDKGMPNGGKPDDATAGRTAAQLLLQREALATGQQPPPPPPVTGVDKLIAQDGVQRALEDNARRTGSPMPVDDRQTARDAMMRQMSTAWSHDAGNAPYTRPAAQMTRDAREWAQDTAPAGRAHADRANAHAEMVDHLNNAWRGAA